MKRRTKEESTAYARTLRARKRAAKIAAALVAPVAPIVAPPAAPCQNCARLIALIASMDCAHTEATQLNAAVIARLTTDNARLEAQAALYLAEITKRDAQQNPSRPTDDAEALRQPVIAAKMDRINTFGRNPVIGRARM